MYLYSIFVAVLCILLNTAVFADSTKIGLNLALSGASAELGSDCIRGHELALSLSDANSQKLHFIVENNRSEPKVAVDAMRKLIETDKVSLVLTHRSPVGMALNPISKLKKIPLIGALGHKDFVPNNEYAFQAFPTTEVEGSVLANFFIAKGLKTLSVLTTEDEWTKSLSEIVIEKFKASGGSVVFNETILPGESDVLSVLTKLKSKKADAVFLDHTLGEIGIVFKKAKQLGVQGVLASNYWINYDSVIKIIGAKDVEEIYFPDMRFSYDKFRRAYESTYQREKIGGPSLCCYLATFTITEADKLVRNGEATNLYEALIRMNQVNLPDGPIQIKDRVLQIPVAIMKIHDGKVVEVEEELSIVK